MLKSRPLNYIAAVIYLAAPFTMVMAQDKGITPLSVQAESLPEEFRTSLFTAPVSARVIVNGSVLGDALVMLYENNTIHLIAFTDTVDSKLPETQRQAWLEALKTPVALGRCEKGCPATLIAVDYSLENAQLSLVTESDSHVSKALWHELPESGSSGLIVGNQFNLSASQGTTPSMSWTGDAEGSMGSWTSVSRMQAYTSSETTTDWQIAATALYLERELEGSFFRGGYFVPESQGILREPYSRGGRQRTLTGLMTGSSDARFIAGESASLYPVYVTANRESVVEIYRNDVLLDSQLIEPGLQPVDTTRLPGGIYDVTLRVLEDGREVSRSLETIHKPMQWKDLSRRLRYNLFGGQLNSLSAGAKKSDDGEMTAGASVNYLLLSSLTGGLAVQKVGQEHQGGVSLDWQAGSRLRFYGNSWYSDLTGSGFDSQTQWSWSRGNLVFSHGRSWLRPYDLSQKESNTNARTGVKRDERSSLAISQRFQEQSMTARLSYASQSGGMGYDLSWNTRSQWGETSINWQTALFDRPYQEFSNSRNRGVSLTASFTFGAQGRSLSASVGSRNDSTGRRDMYLTGSVGQTWAKGPIKESSLGITADRHGVGVSNWNNLESDWANGSVWGQSSSENQRLSGGVNLNNTLAFGGAGASLSQHNGQRGAGVIVDVISDDADAVLQANHSSGSYRLTQGRNFVPVSAWKAGNIDFDFPGSEDPGLKISPERVSYHLNRGGVARHEVRVMKTVMVMGRVVNGSGEPLPGAKVVNHAGQSVTEHDGIFTMPVSHSAPVLNIESVTGQLCTVQLAKEKLGQEQKVIFAGDLRCAS